MGYVVAVPSAVQSVSRFDVREAAAPYGPGVNVSNLGDEICSVAAKIHAATCRFLRLIARFDRLRGWEAEGQKSCAYWLSYRTGLDLGAAREHVRVARSLEQLPITRETMSRGELSFSQVRALTRVARPDTEADLVEVAREVSTAKLEKLVRAWKVGTRRTEAELAKERHDSRKLSVFPDDDGMYVIHGRLEPEVGAIVQRAIEAATDQLYKPERVTSREASRRRADALGLLAERALEGESKSVSRADRYQVVLHVDNETLSRDGDLGRSELEDGTRVSAETSRRIACDASLVKVARGKDGSVLDIGRRTRTTTPALKRALGIRDGGCTFPGCGSKHVDAHHVKHWADGGETSLDNTVLLCRHHHRLVHEGGWKLELTAPGKPVFTPLGKPILTSPGTPVLTPPEGTAQRPKAPGQAASHSRPARVEICRKKFLAKYGQDANPMEAARLWKTTADIPEDILADT